MSMLRPIFLDSSDQDYFALTRAEDDIHGDIDTDILAAESDETDIQDIEEQTEDDAQAIMAEESESDTESERMEIMTLEPEADPFKRLINKINHLASTGLEEDLLYAYELSSSALVQGRFNYNPALVDQLKQKFTEVYDIINQKPGLSASLNSSYSRTIDDLPQPSLARPALTPLQDGLAPDQAPTPYNTTNVLKPDELEPDNPFIIKPALFGQIA